MLLNFMDVAVTDPKSVGHFSCATLIIELHNVLIFDG